MPISEKSAERLFNASKKVYDVMRNSIYWVLIIREEGVLEFVDSIGQIEDEMKQQ